MLIIPLGPVLEIRFGFLFLASAAFIFGPVVGFSAGVLTNMLGFLLFSGGGTFNPLFDLNVGFSGILYALFLYKRNPESRYFAVWLAAARISVSLICNIIINTRLLMLMGFIPSEGAAVITTVRLFKNITLLPVEIILMFIVLKFTAAYAKKYKFIK
ncbi:MAG: folate family ECF transporter S component [Oscillospiraceae bacterium]|nr:folate family ECF transporter S component [Oscillospiraceae bacterium]